MRLSFILCLFFVSSLLFATEDPVEVKSTIKKVTVFKEGAQVSRMAKADLPKGKTIYKFTGLTSDLDAKSLQFKGDGDFTVLSVNHQLNFFEETDKSDTLINLEGEILQLQQQVEEWNIQIKVLAEEEKLILENNKKGGKEEESLSVDDLRAMAAFYRSQVAEVRLSQLDLKRKINAQLKDIRKFQQQINEIKSKNQGVETSEVLVTVVAENPVKGSFELRYFVLNAGWTPTYDIRVQDVQNPINLVYKTNVFQSTGELWEEVKLTLSTANPKQSGAKPELDKWNLGFYNPYAARSSNHRDQKSKAIVRPDGSRVIKGRILDESGEALIGANILVPGTTTGTVTDFDGYYSMAVPAGSDQLIISYIGYNNQTIPINSLNQGDVVMQGGVELDEVVVTGLSSKSSGVRASRKSKKDSSKPLVLATFEKVTSVEFQIDLPYTIQSDGKDYMVSIQSLDIPAYYEYHCVPKLDKDAFLTAMITDWEDYKLLTGNTNLYFEGTFIGTALLEVDNIQDTLSISLGRDKNILVERTLLKDYSKKQFIGNKKVETRAIKIEVRNKKNQPINLVVEDQFPVSITGDIEVKRETYAGASLDDNSGKLLWRLSIPAESQEKVGFSYTVKYPKKELVLLD